MADVKRVNRVAELLRKEISSIINQQLKDPLVGMSTVSYIKLTNDLSYARVYISIIGDEKARANTLKGLERASKYIRSELGHRTDLRFVPELKFIHDDSVTYAMNIEELIKKANS